MSAHGPKATSARGVPLAKRATVTEAARRCRSAASCVPSCPVEQTGPRLPCAIWQCAGRETSSRDTTAEAVGASSATLSLRIALPAAGFLRSRRTRGWPTRSHLGPPTDSPESEPAVSGCQPHAPEGACACRAGTSTGCQPARGRGFSSLNLSSRLVELVLSRIMIPAMIILASFPVVNGIKEQNLSAIKK
jgi:hypothetical protein